MTSSPWSSGYFSEESYIVSHYSSQEPTALRTVFLLQQVAWSAPQEGLIYVDVGCGRGFTTCLLAAANPSWTVIGLDFLPAHVGEAQALAAEAGLTNVSFHEVDLSQITDADAAQLVPEADVITLHGVWSWVAPVVQDGILRVLNRLKPGGAAMVSYNALPGWSDALGMQALVRRLVDAGMGPASDRISAAMKVIADLRDAKAHALVGSRHTETQIKAAEERGSVAYVAHELLNEGWRPYFVHEVWERLARAKLDYVGSATLADNFLPFQVSAAQREIVDSLPPGPTRELAIDLCADREFRRDIFVRGRRPMVPSGAWRDMRLIRASDGPVDKVKFQFPAGEGEVPAATVGALMDALADGPRTIGELLTVPEASRMSPWELLPTLFSGGFARPLWRDDTGPDGEAAVIARRFCHAANRRYLTEEKITSGIAMPIPCLGAGIPCRPPELAVNCMLFEAQERSPEAPLPNEVVIARRLMRPDAPSDAIVEAEASIRDMLQRGVPALRRLGLLR
ncbi:MAG TPA: class I SAM-dependent methyltransferase [Acetobacteraceae bacterium]|nr:class I SAM-dependent methyltransferase [Acetobacteraceae bacterium]